MRYCPECGSENSPSAERCWECQQHLDPEPSFDDELDESWLDDEPKKKVAATYDDEDLDGGDDEVFEAEHKAEVADDRVVAFVAQDEVQAGTISQLLSDCGIPNYASSEEEKPDTRGTQLSVQVLPKDLEAARSIIDDFTAMFEEQDDLVE